MIDYNSGNPDGVLQEGEEPREPNVPLVAIYPEEGTLYSDNPLYVLDAEWVDDDEAAAAEQFIDFVQQRENQEQILELRVPAREPGRVDRQPDRRQQRRRPRPAADAARGARSPRCSPSCSTTGRTSASRRACCSSSTSRARCREVADPDTGATKLDLAKQATITALDEFNDDDEVGLWVFSTDLGDQRRPRGPVPRAGAHRPDRRRAREPQDQGARPPPHQRHAAVPRHPARLRAAGRGVRPRPASTPWCCSPTA